MAIIRCMLALILLVMLAACTAAVPTSPATVPMVPSSTLAPVASATAESPRPTVTSSHLTPCTPTLDDGMSPSYQPDMPVRESVGHGHILTGVVRSSTDCSPITNAKLELWPEESGKGHPDETRATLFTNEHGEYRFECNPPEHIHMRISAPGHRTIGVNSYHPEGRAKGRLDIVLAPASN